MTVTYIGNDLYEVIVSHPEHPVEQSVTISKQDVIALVEAVDKLDFFTDEDFHFLDFVCIAGGC